MSIPRDGPLTVLTHLAPGYPTPLFQRLTALMGVTLACPVELLVDSTTSGPSGGAPDRFSTGSADVGFICSPSYIGLHGRRPSPIALVGAGWVPLDPKADGRPVYFTDVVVGTDSDAQSLEDLAGTNMACNDGASLSGHYALRIELDRLGFDPDRHWHTVFTGGHRESIAALLAGSVDAAALDSIVLWNARRNDPEVETLRTVRTLGPFTVQPAVVAANLALDEREAIRAALLDAHLTLSDELAAAGLSHFAPLASGDYDQLAADLDHISRTTG